MPLVGLWLCGYVWRLWGLVWVEPFGMHCHDVGCLVHTLPLFSFVRWYAYHACLCHPLALYAFLHAYLHVHAWVLLVSVSFMLQQNETMDFQSKPTFVPLGRHLLFALLLVCLCACFLAFGFFACCAYHAYPFYALCIFSFHCLFVGFLSFAFACTHMERGHMELGCEHKQKGRGRKHVDMS